jgi:hypothetical protein
MRHRRVVLAIAVAVTAVVALAVKPGRYRLESRLLSRMTFDAERFQPLRNSGATGTWAFAFVEFRNSAGRPLVLDYGALDAAVRTNTEDSPTSVDLWGTPAWPKDVWLEPHKGVKVRILLPPGAETFLVRTRIRKLTSRESLEVHRRKSGLWRLPAAPYLWLRDHLPDEPRWSPAEFEFDVDETQASQADETPA